MLRPAQSLSLCTFCLLVVGVVFVNSASLGVAGGEGTTLAGILFGRHTLYAAASLACLVIGASCSVDRLVSGPFWRTAVPWIAVAILLSISLVHVPGIGREVNGARRWIAIGPIGLQPSEFAKWGFPVLIAWWCTRPGADPRSFVRGFLIPLAALGVACLAIAAEDLGTAVLIMAVGILTLLAAGTRWIYALGLIPPAAAAFAALVLLSPYRVNRILAYLDPYADSRGIGYHIIQSMGSIAGGGIGGRGLGNSVQKFGYLPEGTTDFIYAIIVEEAGVLGAVLVVGLFVGLVLSGAAILLQRRADGQPRHSTFARLFGLAVIATIGLQALINVAVVTGIAPTKGIALPLISRGGTGWMLTAFSIGLIVSMDARARRVAERGAAPADALPATVRDAPGAAAHPA